MKPYVPQPGTIPHRVIAHLKTLPPGTELASAVIADAIGHPVGSIAACLNAPRSRGALKSRMDGGIMRWSLGDNVPVPPPPDHVPDEPLHPVPKVPAKPASPFDLRKPRGLTPRDAKPAPALDIGIPISTPTAAPDMGNPISPPAPATEPETNRAKFGIYSDGTFCVQRDQDAIWLTASETKELAEFINKNT